MSKSERKKEAQTAGNTLWSKKAVSMSMSILKLFVEIDSGRFESVHRFVCIFLM